MIGFAGPRVIEQTIGEKLPKGFQRSEFLLEHGFIDRIVERNEMKQVLGDILAMHSVSKECPKADEIQEALENRNEFGNRKTPWERVQISREKDRPVGQDYLKQLFPDFMEFHGDRAFGDDKAVIGGIARFHGRPVTVIVQSKGKSTKENLERHFGMPSPEGYRKALRLMKQAEKFQRPVLCFVDTPGAFCGVEAEERGQGEAIARNLFEMAALTVPVLSVVIGEGGSGGALAMAVANEVWMMENAIYSILSPEGFAAILWKDSTRAKEAAEVMKMTASDLKKAGIVEKVIPEKTPAQKEEMDELAACIKSKIKNFLEIYSQKDEAEIVKERYERFRKMGEIK